MKKVFIDGKAGTTGLQIYQRLGSRKDIQVLTLPEEQRKDPNCRRDMFGQADVVFLCLPDEAAKQAVELAEGPDTVVIDTSTAHRVAPAGPTAFRNCPPPTGSRSSSPSASPTLAATPAALSASFTR